MHAPEIDTTPALLRFGDGLGTPGCAGLRRYLRRLTDGRLDRPMLADTVFAIDARRAESPPRRERGWMLLFDLHRLLLYDDPGTPETPGAASIVRHLFDAYPFDRLDDLTAHFQQHPYRYLYPLDTLDLLTALWPLAQPGTLFIVDVLQGEVRRVQPHLHPESCEPTPRIVPPEEATGSIDVDPQREVANPEVGGDLRLPGRADLDGVVSKAVGIVREEVVNQTFVSDVVSTTRLAQGRQRTDVCGGQSLTHAGAVFVARCEAIERYHVAFRRPQTPLVRGSYDDLTPHAVDPDALFYRRLRPAPNQTDYRPDLPLLWTWMLDVQRRAPVLVPAQEVWFNTRRLAGTVSCVQSTTSGGALGNSYEEALLFGLLELIERDGYLTAWYLRRVLDRIDPASVRYEPFHLLLGRVRRLFPTYAFYFLNAMNDVGVPVVWGVAVKQAGEGLHTIHASAAHLVTEQAMYSVLKDLAMRFGFQETFAHERARFEAMLEDPERIGSSGEDNLGLYGLEAAFPRLDFLRLYERPAVSAQAVQEAALVPEPAPYHLGDVLERLVEHLHGLDVAVMAKDITQAPFAARGLRCVKTAATHLLPTYYGYHQQRLSLTPRLQTLARTFTGRDLQQLDDLNLWMHPFS